MSGNFKLDAFDPITSIMYSSHLSFYVSSVAFYRSSVRIYTLTEVNYASSLAFFSKGLTESYFFDSLL
jgi:hypothetical protein